MGYRQVLEAAKKAGYSEEEVRQAISRGISKAFLKANERGISQDKLKARIDKAGIPPEIWTEPGKGAASIEDAAGAAAESAGKAIESGTQGLEELAGKGNAAVESAAAAGGKAVGGPIDQALDWERQMSDQTIVHPIKDWLEQLAPVEPRLGETFKEPSKAAMAARAVGETILPYVPTSPSGALGAYLGGKVAGEGIKQGLGLAAEIAPRKVLQGLMPIGGGAPTAEEVLDRAANTLSSKIKEQAGFDMAPDKLEAFKDFYAKQLSRKILGLGPAGVERPAPGPAQQPAPAAAAAPVELPAPSEGVNPPAEEQPAAPVSPKAAAEPAPLPSEPPAPAATGEPAAVSPTAPPASVPAPAPAAPQGAAQPAPEVAGRWIQDPEAQPGEPSHYLDSQQSPKALIVTDDVNGKPVFNAFKVSADGEHQPIMNPAAPAPSSDFDTLDQATKATEEHFPIAPDGKTAENPYAGFQPLKGSGYEGNEDLPGSLQQLELEQFSLQKGIDAAHEMLSEGKLKPKRQAQLMARLQENKDQLEAVYQEVEVAAGPEAVRVMRQRVERPWETSAAEQPAGGPPAEPSPNAGKPVERTSSETPASEEIPSGRALSPYLDSITDAAKESNTHIGPDVAALPMEQIHPDLRNAMQAEANSLKLDLETQEGRQKALEAVRDEAKQQLADYGKALSDKKLRDSLAPRQLDFFQSSIARAMQRYAMTTGDRTVPADTLEILKSIETSQEHIADMEAEYRKLQQQELDRQLKAQGYDKTPITKLVRKLGGINKAAAEAAGHLSGLESAKSLIKVRGGKGISELTESAFAAGLLPEHDDNLFLDALDHEARTKTPRYIPRAPEAEGPSGGGGGSTRSSIGTYIPENPAEIGTVPEIKAFRMPEMVKLAKMLMGDVPAMQKFAAAYGKFYGVGAGEIRLDPRIFAMPGQAAKTLAHEIGHLIDYLPDRLLSRGNLLGRLRTLQKYMRDTFEGDLFKNLPGINSTAKEIREELKAVTRYWKPFDEAKVPPSYVKYRYSSVELYADAISVLLNSPGSLERLAPKFYKAFFEGLDLKPDVKDAFFGLMDFLNKPEGEQLAGRKKDIREMFAKGEDLYAQKRAEKETQDTRLWESLMRQVVDRNYPMLKKIANLEKAGVAVDPAKNPKYLLEEMSLADNANHVMLARIEKEIMQPLARVEASVQDLGQYLMMNRITQGDRSDVANPLGYTKEEAQRMLDHQKAELGPKPFEVLEDAVKHLHQIIFEVNQRATEVGIYSKDSFEKDIMPNKDSYAPFAVLDYLQDFMPAGIKSQIGTFKEIANPFTSLIMKTMSVNRLIAYQDAKNGFRDTWLEHFPDEISKAEIVNPQDQVKIFRSEPGKGQLMILEDGKPVAYNVDPWIAEAFEKGKAGDLNVGVRIVRAMNDHLFRPLYITYNLGFSTTFHGMVNFMSTYKLNPNASLKQLLLEYVNSFPAAVRRARGINDELIQEMIDNKALDVPFSEFNLDPDADQYAHILKRAGIIREKPGAKSTTSALLKPITSALDGIRFAGSVLETLHKVAGYKLRKAAGESGKELAYNVRNFVGTPNFRRRGTQTDTTNALFMFSNIMKEHIRTHLEIVSNPKTRGGYAMKTAMLNILPKLLMVLGTTVAGKELKEFFDNIPEYDKTNYQIIPLGWHTGDKGQRKAVYFKVPNDELGRLMSGMFWKMANVYKGDPKQWMHILDFGAGQLPKLSPAITMAEEWGMFLTGKNPYDYFHGRPLIPEKEFKAGQWPALKRMVRTTIDEFGFTSFSHFDPDKQTPTETAVQQIPILNRLIKISDYGLREKERAQLDQYEQKKAATSLERGDNQVAFSRDLNVLREKKAAGVLSSQEQQQLTIMSKYAPMVHNYSTAILRAEKAGNEKGVTEMRARLEKLLEKVVRPR